MVGVINLYSNKKNEINRFLNMFYDDIYNLENDLKWELKFSNPIEVIDLFSTIIDNNDKFDINVWLSIDDGIFINVTEHNLNNIVKYLYERFPY